MDTLVIVESPTKAKTIRKFLPDSYTVAASMGHIRDLPRSASEIPESIKKSEWVQIGVNYTDDFQPIYIIPSDKKKIVSDLKKKIKLAKKLILATDVDREGESISWHLKEVLSPKIPVSRMVFHEITKSAIDKALKEPRDIDINLVRAQETRRILDRLVGYTLSPLLWKKIAVGLSAGRVQSVAVRQIVERERMRIRFVKADYWDLKGTFEKQGKLFEAVLIKIAGKNVATGKNFDENTGTLKSGRNDVLLNSDMCDALLKKMKSQPFIVKNIESKAVKKNPPPPFTTSTLQQAGNRKLGMSSKETMRTAQSLYENGYITYMRTDSVTLSSEALTEIKNIISKKYGKDYLPKTTNKFKNTVKNAQEAHEAIRPAGSFVEPEKSNLSGKEKALYEMIWKCAVASQMESARLTYNTVFLENGEGLFRASGKKIDFKGFFTLYMVSHDDGQRDDDEALLPELTKGETVPAKKIDSVKHTTQPPPRYTEASLIHMLEKGGVGRPSTYSSIISTIIDRKYVRKDKNLLTPSFTAFAVTRLLEENFKKLVDLNFTADMEEILDNIANGKVEYKKYLEEFYHGNEGLYSQTKEKTGSIESITYRNIELPNIQAKIMLGRYGPYLEKISDTGTLNVSIPDEVSPGDITNGVVNELLEMKKIGGNSIGIDTATKKHIYVLNGKFGPFVQLGEVIEGEAKPKRVPLLKSMTMQNVTIDIAHRFLSLPLKLGKHSDGGEISFSVGRFGPYVQLTKPNNLKEYRSVKDHEFMTIDLKRALEVLSEEKKNSRSSKVIKVIGMHPVEQKEINLYEGPYGKFIKFGGSNYAVGKEADPDSLTVEQAIEIMAKKTTTRKKRYSKGTSPQRKPRA